jgi:hypothetical protein
MQTERLATVLHGREEAMPARPTPPAPTTYRTNGRPPARIRIPGLLDVVLVDDPAQIAALNAEPAVTREIDRSSGFLGRIVAARLRTFTVDGQLLPVFRARTDVARLRAQAALGARLDREAADTAPRAAAIQALARYVIGAGDETDVGVAVQELVGRLFVPDYRATSETYAAATLVAASPRANPVQAWWWRASGALDRARTLLWDRTGGDPGAIHATTIAFHNIVESLGHMRALAATDGPRGLAADAVAQCLVAPATLLRICTRETAVPFLDRPLAPGTLIVFRLERAHASTGDDALALLRGEWSQCPAHRFVPELLSEVWTTAAGIWPLSTTTAPEAGLTAKPEEKSLLARMFWRAYDGAFSQLNRVVPWHRLPTWLAVLNLLALRNVLRDQNLYDTEAPSDGTSEEAPPPSAVCTRGLDGRFNDLAHPRMGAAGARFGRNFPRDLTYPNVATLQHPNPRTVSQCLLRRDTFVPATTLNLLAAAWIQFQVHDWFMHDVSETEFVEIPLEPSDPWFQNPMHIRRTQPDRNPRDPAGAPPAYANSQTHWWDASQLYGSDSTLQRRLRTQQDGKLRVLPSGLLPYDPATGIEITGFNENWWVGLSLLHTLFTLEHNAICDRLKEAYPGWDDDRLFETARLVNAALLAKIHTVEWTPAILGHPALQIGMNANWWGLAGERLTKMLGRLSDSEALSGIPGSATDHHKAPYALTEEFAAVYRMHPLMPDELQFFSNTDGSTRETVDLLHASGKHTRALLDRIGMPDLLYSFGVTHPGAVTLHNYPRALQDLERLNGDRIDLASVEIFRDRERGIPRYNTFRRLLHMNPVRTFDELTSNPAWARELEEIYGGDIEAVDAMVGMYAETPPKGFGFSDTAFRVFILMASRRLKSDRFFTADFTPQTYTPVGIEWVQTNDMRSVLLRHHPELASSLHLIRNAFAPWHPIATPFPSGTQA